MALATVDRNNAPNIHGSCKKLIMGLFLQMKATKGQEIALNNNAALCFYWKSIRKQIQFRGPVSMIKEERVR